MGKRIWWCISVKGAYLGKCEATEVEIKRACGPWSEIVGNHVNIYAPPK